ncbi:MAG: alpha/beta hydrolase [Ignavibacteriales bacterium]|nr:alpha/beta hydrolase [Ignavibacteriales bacterium]
MHSFWLEPEQIYIRYLDSMNGKTPLIFIHGLGASSIADFGSILMDRSFDSYRCVLIDLPGHGFSDKPQNFSYTLYSYASVVERLIEHLNLASVTLVGHSLGGTVAIALLQKREDLVYHIILMEPNLDPGVGTGSRIIAAQAEDAFVNKGYVAYLSALQVIGSESASASIYPGTFAVASPLAVHRSAVGLLAGTAPPQREILQAAKAKRTYMVGDQNINDVPLNELKELGLDVFIVPQAGHAMMHDNPEKFREILLQAIANANS